jgi:hypothetical protein
MAAYGFQLEWARQIGTGGNDRSWFINGNTVTFDGTGSYFGGTTDGAPSSPSGGSFWDGLLGKYDSAGTLQWATFVGTTAYDELKGVSADGLGNLFVSGWTTGVMANSNAGASDFWVQRYDVNGNLSWTQQFGTGADDRATGIAADGFGNAYVAGFTGGALAGPFTGQYDAFLYKFDSAGNTLWSRQLGASPLVWASSVAADSAGNAYITGLTWGNLAAPAAGFGDVFVTKYDPAGNLQWSAQVGSVWHEEIRALAVDSVGNVYLTGYTHGSLAAPNAGLTDVILLKYNAAGVLQWSQQMGTAGADYGDGVAVDSAGNIYVSGSAMGSLYGPHLGNADLFLAKFDPAGNLLDSAQLGTAQDEFNSSIAVVAPNVFYVSGGTNGSFGGSLAGGEDIFHLKFNVPEPSAGMLLAGALVGWAGGRMRRSGVRSGSI